MRLHQKVNFFCWNCLHIVKQLPNGITMNRCLFFFSVIFFFFVFPDRFFAVQNSADMGVRTGDDDPNVFSILSGNQCINRDVRRNLSQLHRNLSLRNQLFRFSIHLMNGGQAFQQTTWICSQKSKCCGIFISQMLAVWNGTGKGVFVNSAVKNNLHPFRYAVWTLLCKLLHSQTDRIGNCSRFGYS